MNDLREVGICRGRWKEANEDAKPTRETASELSKNGAERNDQRLS